MFIQGGILNKIMCQCLMVVFLKLFGTFILRVAEERSETILKKKLTFVATFKVSRNTGLVNSLRGKMSFSFISNSVAMVTDHILYLNIHDTP